MRKFLIYCVMLVVGTLFMRAQVANNTSLVGTIIDASGGVVVGAHVTAVNAATKVSYSGDTNAQGYYSIQFIAPGTYDVTVTQQGFQKSVSAGVLVQTNQAVRTNITLKPGSTSSTVTVSASSPALATDSSFLGETFDQKQVTDLPVMGHSALDVATLASNVYIGSKTSYTGIPPGEDLEGAGQREIQNSLSLDGISIMNNLITTSPTRPSTEMISEVQMQSGNYPAQYGGYLGIHVNMVSKSGTNDLHGEAYDYVENTALNAKPFTLLPGKPTPILHWNQYGFNLGGPVYIPKIYNGRNKTFFFGSYEKLNNTGQNSGIASVLTPAMEKGDFTALGTLNNAGVCTGTCLKDPATGTYYTPNNIIPASELNSASGLIAQAYEKYMVAPNLPGITNNLNTSYPNSYSIKQTLDRVDENIGEHIHLFFRVHWQNLNVVSGSFFPANSSYGPTDTRNYAFGYTHVITPSLVNDFRFGVNKLISNNVNYWYQNGLSDAGTALGIPGFNLDTVDKNPGVPVVSIASSGGSGGYQGVGNAGSNWFQDDRTYDLYDELSYTKGKHNIMAGLEFRRLTIGRAAENNPLGLFTFSAGEAGVTSTGNAAADFVIGYANQDQTPIVTVKGSVGQWRDGFFVLDNWQVSQNLTLNYGLRYDLPTVPYSLNGYARILNQTEDALIPPTDATSAKDFVPTPGFQFTGPQHDNWAPRFGFAYRATEKTVIRGGFGIYFNPNQLNSYTLATGNYPLAATVNYNTAPGAILTFINNTPGAGSASPVAGIPGTYVSAFTDDYHNKTQRSYQWNLSTGFEFWKQSGFELQYLGSHDSNLDRSFYDNEPLVPGPGSVNSRRPNQLFGQIRRIENDGWSNYNALTAILRQRTFHGLAGQVSYTWSHDLDLSTDSNGGGTLSQQYNPKADYGNSNWDIRNRMVASLTYALPLLSNSNYAVRQALGGWELASIINVQSGMPFNVALNYNSANLSAGTERPNWVHPPHADCSLSNYIHGNKTSCIDTTAYALPANINANQYAFGNTSRNTLHGPGFSYVNLSAFKTFNVVGRLAIQFRAEAFNVFNHPSAANPSASIGHDSSPIAQPTFLSVTGFGSVTGVQQVPGSVSGARVLSLAGKIVF